jgi:hypothetical protein
MSDTPRTDAECGWYDPNGIRYQDPTGDHVDPDFARQLERELATVTANALALSQANAELRSRIRRLEAAGNAMCHEMQFGEWQSGTPKCQANAARDSWRAEMGGRV